MYNYKQAVKNDIIRFMVANDFDLEPYRNGREINCDTLQEHLEANKELRNAAAHQRKYRWEKLPDRDELSRRLVDAMDFNGRNLLTELVKSDTEIYARTAKEMDEQLRVYLFYEALNELVEEMKIRFESGEEEFAADELTALYEDEGKPTLAGVKAVSPEEICDELIEELLDEMMLDETLDVCWYEEIMSVADIMLSQVPSAIDYFKSEKIFGNKDGGTVLGGLEMLLGFAQGNKEVLCEDLENCSTAAEKIRARILLPAVGQATFAWIDDVEGIQRSRSEGIPFPEVFSIQKTKQAKKNKPKSKKTKKSKKKKR